MPAGRTPLLVLMLLPALGMGLFSCQTSTQTHEKPLFPLTGIRTVLVLPFQNMAEGQPENACIVCPVCAHMYRCGDVPENAASYLDQQLTAMLPETGHTRFVTADPADEPLARPQAGQEGDVITRLAAAGKQAGVDAVLIGCIFRFQERDGSDYAAKSAASVAFDLHAVRVNDGRIFWTGKWDETQLALSEDLFTLKQFIQRKGRWISARELALEGLTQMLKPFENK